MKKSKYIRPESYAAELSLTQILCISTDPFGEAGDFEWGDVPTNENQL